MALVYVKSVANDFPEGAVDQAVLSSDIGSHVPVLLSTVLVVGDVVTITFLLDVDSTNEAILNDIIDHHLVEEFQFSVSGDFPNQAVDLSVLQLEIESSTISETVGGVDLEGDDIGITFQNYLVYGDYLTLLDVVANHQGEGTAEGVQLLFSESEQTETGNSFVTAAQLDSLPLAPGYYTVKASCELALDTADGTSAVQVQVQWNGQERSIHVSGESLYTTFYTEATVLIDELTAPSLILNFRRIGTANTAKVRRIRMSIVPEMTEVTEV